MKRANWLILFALLCSSMAFAKTVNLMKLEATMVPRAFSQGFASKVSFEQAMIKGAFLGQLNPIPGAQFIGPGNLIVGYDNATLPEQTPHFFLQQGENKIPVYDIEPLIGASIGYLKQFPVSPGTFVSMALKSKTMDGPTFVWSALILAVTKDRDQHASVLLLDAGRLNCDGYDQCRMILAEKIKQSALNILQTGSQNKIDFKDVFVGFKILEVPLGYVGTALAVVPFIDPPLPQREGIKKITP